VPAQEKKLLFFIEKLLSTGYFQYMFLALFLTGLIFKYAFIYFVFIIFLFLKFIPQTGQSSYIISYYYWAMYLPLFVGFEFFLGMI
jgi:hypothetical protein